MTPIEFELQSELTSLRQQLEEAKAELAMEKSYADDIRERLEDHKEAIPRTKARMEALENQLTIALDALEKIGNNWASENSDDYSTKKRKEIARTALEKIGEVKGE